MEGGELVEGIVVPPSGLSLTRSAWFRWGLPIATAFPATWLAVIIAGNRRALVIAGPFAIPALILIEGIAAFLGFGRPAGGEAREVVVTRLGVVSRSPSMAVFIPWSLTESVRQYPWPFGATLPFRVSSKGLRLNKWVT